MHINSSPPIYMPIYLVHGLTYSGDRSFNVSSYSLMRESWYLEQDWVYLMTWETLYAGEIFLRNEKLKANSLSCSLLTCKLNLKWMSKYEAEHAFSVVFDLKLRLMNHEHFVKLTIVRSICIQQTYCGAILYLEGQHLV